VEKADIENLPYGRAAYALMDGIDTFGKLFNAKKRLNYIWAQIQMVNLFSARQNDAIFVATKL